MTGLLKRTLSFIGWFLVLVGVSGNFPATADEMELQRWKSPSTGMEFLKIPGGCYSMGDDTGYDYEKPAHEVCVDSFYLGRYEVTQREWSLFMEENRSKFSGENHPVDHVSFQDAVEFIKRMNEKEQTTLYRLPTEAEWERAARAGTTSRYYWGDEIDNDYVWYYGSSNFRTHPVGTARPNPWGLYDMLGNVWEWVSDWYDFDYYKKSPKDNPKGPRVGKHKTRRGGSMANLASYVRSASRYRSGLKKRHHILGFRVARSLSVSHSEGKPSP
jgi:formylglycine-generating enzyme required for sulfatase activity